MSPSWNDWAHPADNARMRRCRQAPSLTRPVAGRHPFSMPNTVDSSASDSPAPAAPPSPSASARDLGLLVKIETDRRLGHEWGEWNGEPLPNAGDFRTTTGKYFLFTALGIGGIVIAGAV